MRYTKSYVKQNSTQENLLVCEWVGEGRERDLMDAFTLVLCELVSLNMMVGDLKEKKCKYICVCGKYLNYIINFIKTYVLLKAVAKATGFGFYR